MSYYLCDTKCFSILDLNGYMPHPFFAEFLLNGFRRWCFIDMKDFFEWLNWKNKDYLWELKSRHFFNNDKSVVEDFYSSIAERRSKARTALDGYLSYQALQNFLPGFNGKINLNNTSMLFREVQFGFLSSRDKYPSLPCKKGYTKYDYLASKYGRDWVDTVSMEGKRYGYRFGSDGADFLCSDERVRNLFYDTGKNYPELCLLVRKAENREIIV